MMCVCSLAGTSACASCFYNPNGSRQANNFMTWNTRAEMGYKDALILLDEMGLSERICRADYRGGGYGIGGWYCSECGGYMHDDLQQDMAYCPNCGAKVVGE